MKTTQKISLLVLVSCIIFVFIQSCTLEDPKEIASMDLPEREAQISTPGPGLDNGDGPAVIDRSPWEMHEGEGIVGFGFRAPYHGAEVEYQFARIPGQNEAGWRSAPDPDIIAYSQIPSTLCNVMGCRDGGQFTYFQTFVDIPANTEITTFTIDFTQVDDGVRTTIFNSDYPQGGVIPGSYVFLGGSGTANLAEMVKPGETNRVVVTHVDDCCYHSYLGSARVVINGIIIPLNDPPIADAGPDVTIEQSSLDGAVHQMDGTGSYDPDGDVITYQWDAPGITINNPNSPTPDAIFPLGTTTVTLVVTDPSGESDSDQMVVTVVDTTEPDLNVPPDVTVEQETRDGTVVPLQAIALDICDASVDIIDDTLPVYPLGRTVVTFSAIDDSGNNISKTTNVNVVDTTPPVLSVPADVVVEQATKDGTVVPLQATAEDICDSDVDIYNDGPSIFPLGTTIVTFTAVDDSGNVTEDTTIVTVIDTTPPVLDVTSSTTSLWPPNHKYVTVTFGITATDICDTDVINKVQLVSVTSDEPEETHAGENAKKGGDGHTEDDIIIVNLTTLKLRAERLGGSDGRVYTVTYSVTDASGNTTVDVVTIDVRHNPGKPAIDSGIAYSVYP